MSNYNKLAAPKSKTSLSDITELAATDTTTMTGQQLLDYLRKLNECMRAELEAEGDLIAEYKRCIKAAEGV